MIWLPVLAMPTLADPTEADQQVGVWGGVIVLALVVGTFLLWMNMRKQIGKINVPADQDDNPLNEAGESPETQATAEAPEEPPAE